MEGQLLYDSDTCINARKCWPNVQMELIPVCLVYVCTGVEVVGVGYDMVRLIPYEDEQEEEEEEEEEEEDEEEEEEEEDSLSWLALNTLSQQLWHKACKEASRRCLSGRRACDIANMIAPAVASTKAQVVQHARWQSAEKGQCLGCQGSSKGSSSALVLAAFCGGVGTQMRRKGARCVALRATTKEAEDPVPVPKAAPAAASVARGWQEICGCPVFVPSEPRRHVHFIGGAFVGASPKLFYKDFLESLAEEGEAVVVATPYKLTFDYDAMATDTSSKFDQVVAQLAEEDPTMKDLPSAAIGHSCGALLHTLLAVAHGRHEACILMAFNNKPVSDAIPVPLPPPPEDLKLRERLRNGVEGALADAPVEEALAAAERAIRAAGAAAPSEDFSSRTAPVLSQWGPLLGSVVEGQTEFTLSTEDISARVLSEFPSTRTLVVQFANDFTDESDRLMDLIRQGGGEVEKLRFPGGHTTPLDAPLGSSRIQRLSQSIAAFVLQRPLPGQDAAQEELSRLKLCCY